MTVNGNFEEPKTQRLYYTNSYTTTFQADVVAVDEMEGRPVVSLDRTYFYPTSGGQPNDTGTLAGVPVVDVIAHNDTILHVLGAVPTVTAGQTVPGAVHWPRRYGHMQQHSGQHLLSQIFSRLFGYETVSVHFGADESTLDLDAAAVDVEQLAAAERYANELAYTALPITAYFVNEEQLGTLPLRRPPKVTGEIRIVEIAGFDYSACGGTHVRTTAEITPVKILRQERRRGQTRLTFKCGLRACLDYAERHRWLGETANLFNNEASAVPGLVARTLDQNRELQWQLDASTEKLMGYEVKDLLAAASAMGDNRLIARLYADRGVDALKTLASLLREQPHTIALLGATAGGKLTLVFARSADVDIAMGNLLRDTLKAFGGSGGGRPDFAQGGGVDADRGQEVLDFAERQIVSAR